LTVNHKSIAWATICVCTALVWQSLTVHYNFHGNWSALFYTGSRRPIPPPLESENIYQFRDSDGWDGQFYHYIAHDPLLQRGLANDIDFPRLRYRRILVPGLAALLAAGNPQHVDTAYRLVILLFVLLGAYWLATLAELHGRSPAWGLAFLLVPGTITSIDRMGVDVALAALCVAFVLYERNHKALFGILVLAGVARDTGLLLIAACCLTFLIARKPLRAAIFATAAIPAIAWYLFVNAHTPAYTFDGQAAFPFTGLLDRLLHPMQYPFTPLLTLWMKSLDALAIGGILFAFALAIAVARRNRWSAPALAMLAFTLLGILAWRPGDWLEAYDYGRILSPLLLLLAVDALASKTWLPMLPICLILPRFGMQIVSQVAGVVKGLLGVSGN
jgi:hypothetical protein